MSDTVVTVQVKGAFAAKRSLQRFRKKTVAKIKSDFADQTAELAYQRVLANISRRDFTLEDLREMDHPYARRHGSISVHPGQEYLVHTHTGRLKSSLGKKVVRRAGGAGGGHNLFAQVGFIKNPPHYAGYVVSQTEGTKVMLSRDPINETVNSRDFKKEMLKISASTIKKHT